MNQNLNAKGEDQMRNFTIRLDKKDLIALQEIADIANLKPACLVRQAVVKMLPIFRETYQMLDGRVCKIMRDVKSVQ